LEEVGYVFIYLMRNKVPVCFCRYKAQDFADPNPEMKWLMMKNDLSIGAVTNSYRAGMI